MPGRFYLVVTLVIVGLVVTRMRYDTQRLLAAEPVSTADEAKRLDKSDIQIDVIIEEVDLTANTITARSTIHVVPPHGSVGGQVSMTGTTGSKKDQATRYVRLPFMPEADLKGKKPKPGMHALVKLDLLKSSLVVVCIDEAKEPEQIGVEWLNAPGK